VKIDRLVVEPEEQTLSLRGQESRELAVTITGGQVQLPGQQRQERVRIGGGTKRVQGQLLCFPQRLGHSLGERGRVRFREMKRDLPVQPCA
jgi:hypothetical protein